MKKKRTMRILTCTVAMLSALGCAVALTACGDGHKHEYSKQWSYNETNHWHECECGKKADEAEHTFNGDTCSTCKYQTPTEGLTYELSGTSYCVTGLTPSQITKLVIPSEYKGKPVTAIGKEAFQKRDTMTRVVLPDSITSIGERAFYNCSELNSISLQEGLISIGKEAFSLCEELTFVNIPKSVTSIGERAFDPATRIQVQAGNTKYHSAGDCLIETASKTLLSGCKTSLIPSDGSVTSIADYAFYGCYGLTDVVIPDSVTSIGETSFEYCKDLKNLDVGNGLTIIPQTAFHSCSALENVKIGTHVEEIQYMAFRDCGNIKGVYITDLAAWCQINFSSTPLNEGTTGKADLYLNDQKVTNITIPSKASKISNLAFKGCKSLKSVVISEGVKEIGYSAFRGCKYLEKVTIPKSMTSIDSNAFDECNGLTGVYITDLAAWSQIKFTNDSNPLRNAKNLYLNNKLVTELVIPESITTIKKYTFDGCTSITSVQIPVKVTKIEAYPFRDCSAITDIYYAGTREQWDKVTKDSYWDRNITYTLHCSDDAENA